MYQSFLVRIWQNEEMDPPILEITAESVQSGKSNHFDDLQALYSFLLDQVTPSTPPFDIDGPGGEVGLES